MEKYNRLQCGSHHGRRQFTLKAGTIFEESPIGLDKGLAAMWQTVNCKSGVSSYELGRALRVTQKSAWFMARRIRFAISQSPAGKLAGHVEADEAFIGGKARNMRARKRVERITGTGGKDKIAAMGTMERGGEVRTMAVPNRRKRVLRSGIRMHFEVGAALYTGAPLSYDGLDEFQHQVVSHAVGYADGAVHTNGMENYWSLFKRGLNGTYVGAEPFHLFRRLDEQAFRLNNRADLTDADRLDLAVRRVVGKRITLDQLTGKDGEQEFVN